MRALIGHHLLLSSGTAPLFKMNVADSMGGSATALDPIFLDLFATWLGLLYDFYLASKPWPCLTSSSA